MQETLTITRMDSFDRTIPASMVGISSVSTGIHSRFLDCLNTLVLKTLLDLKELLRSMVFSRVTCGADSGVPRGLLCAKEVSVDIMLDSADDSLSSLVNWISVFIPTVETCLVTGIVQLAVMD